jgi:UDP-N-acetylglucosamine acyltransferase
MIHPSALIDPSAELDPTVSVGPFAVIGPRVRIGAGTKIGPGVLVEQDTVIGRECVLHHHASVGTAAQDLKYRGEPSRAEIGDRVIIREDVTVNRGTAGGCTRIGRACALLAYSHVGHDCVVGESVILSNGVQLGGFVTVEDHANIGGMVPVHQFCRIGCHAFVGGGFRVVQDVPPYVLAAGEPLDMYGINLVGLRRAGFNPAARQRIKDAYRIVYDRALLLPRRLEELARRPDPDGTIGRIVAFLRQSRRGFISPP